MNLYDNISLYNLKNENEKNNIRTNNIINLIIFILSGFNLKIKETPNMNNIFQNEIDLKNNINLLNSFLKESLISKYARIFLDTQSPSQFKRLNNINLILLI